MDLIVVSLMALGSVALGLAGSRAMLETLFSLLMRPAGRSQSAGAARHV